MESLIMMLKNEQTNTYHPIMYLEKPLPYSEESKNIVRYKSKGHRTNGFTDRADALLSIDKELTAQLKDMGYNVNKELDGDLLWDGIEIPADTQIRGIK